MTEIEVLDPATVRPIAAVEDMDETTVDAAVRRARAAFDNGGGWWPGTPDEERGRVLARAAELVRAQADRLARLESLDVGKPIAEAQGDVDEAARILEYYAGWPTKAAGDSYADLGRALRAGTRDQSGRCLDQRLTDRAGAGHLGRVQTVRYRP
jgi:acyl-CoA reductase-like NAD-dependent aldehyde dehydrogenase